MSEPDFTAYTPDNPKRGMSTTAVLSIVIALVVAVVVLAAFATLVIALNGDDTPTPAAASPAPTVTVTTSASVTSPEPTDTASAQPTYDDVETFKNLIDKLAWQKYPPQKQKSLCTGWTLISHATLINAFINGLNSAPQLQNMLSEADMRQAVEEFFNEKCG